MDIEGFSGCSNPANFAIIEDGGFVTGEKGLPRVKIYDADGVFVSVVAPPELFGWRNDGFFGSRIGELDVSVDPQGRVLVLDPVERIVRIFARIRCF